MLSTSPQPLRPIAIKAPQGATVMHVDWSDGHRAVYPHDVLRGFCPCAGCQGHSGAIAYRGGGNTEIRSLATVGNYAITISWGDGHDTGIYRFDFLRSLCRCPACAAQQTSTVGE